MLRSLFLCFILLSCMLPGGFAADLYKVEVNSRTDALTLTMTGVDGMVRLSSGYLVLAEAESADKLMNSGLSVTFVAGDLQQNILAVDKRDDRQNVERYDLIFEEDGFRLYRVDPTLFTHASEPLDVVPILIENMRFEFIESRPYDRGAITFSPDIDSIVGLVRQDSLESYSYTLEDFGGRVAGTSNIVAASEWIRDMFVSFGYESVYFDNFTASLDGVPTACRNVVAVKPGAVFPNQQIVIGAHHDAVWGSPGSDDNGSGTAAVMEIARVMRNIDTEVTLVFVTFDAEEWGLHGAWHYSNEASANGDSIIVMLNMDMIADEQNTNRAWVRHGWNTYYAELLRDLASPHAGITAFLGGTSQSSDHFPFTQNGYDVAYLHEYYFSSVYHSQWDNTSNMSFPYYTKMVKSMIAIVAQLNSDDRDSDGILNLADNCPDDYNPGQFDSDGDSVGNACDNCPDLYNPSQYDENFDGVGDLCDGEFHCMSYDPPTGYLGEPYYYEFWAINGVEPYHWTKVMGQPPYGLVFTGGTEGTLTGTPGYEGTSFMRVAVVDSDSPPNVDTVDCLITVTQPGVEFVCGDANGDEAVDIDDIVHLVTYIFSGGPAPDPIESGDVDCSGEIDIDDVVYLIAYVFTGGPDPCDC